MLQKITSPKFARPLFWFLCMAIGLVSLRILILGMELGFPDMEQHLSRKAVFWTHVLASSAALMLMPFQFWTKLRNRRRNLHRWTGRHYVAMVLAGGISGALLAPFASTGYIAGAGFFLLALAWLSSTIMAVFAARAGDIPKHKRWMIRSGALTFAAVTLRLYLPFAFIPGVSYDIAYPMIAWGCWVPNLLAVEIWAARKSRAALFA